MALPDLRPPGHGCAARPGFVRGKGMFQAIEHVPPGEARDQEYPFLLNTGRILQHYNVTTTYSAGLMSLWKEEYAWVNPDDAGVLGVDTGDSIEVSSWRGKCIPRCGSLTGCRRA